MYEDIKVREHKKKIDPYIISHFSTDATHVVVGIDWGAICTITCQYDIDENENVNEVRCALKAEVENIKLLIESNTSQRASHYSGGQEEKRKFTFNCNADVSTPNKDLLITFKGALEFAHALPKLVEKVNNGKGVPLKYHLMPLQTVARKCRLQINLDLQSREIYEDTFTKCVQLSEKITKKRQALLVIQHDMHANDNYIPDHAMKSIDNMCSKPTAQESRFKSELPKLIISVRWGLDDISVVDEFLDKLDLISASDYNNAIVDFQNALRKVNMIKSWWRKGIQYIGKHDNMLLNKPHVYVLYITSHVSDKENLDKNETLFLRKQATHAIDNGYVFIVVDQVLSNQLWLTEIRKATIRVYVNGKLECSDLYAEEGQDSEKCLLKISSPVPCQAYPKNRTFVKLRCANVVAGNGHCLNDNVLWNCSECKEFVEYGIDDRSFYCKCGKSNPEQAMFRCNDKNHDMRFVKYPRDILRVELSQHRAMMTEINILIRGEIRVGKST